MMQYRTTCNNCGREYMVDGNPGETIKAICPFCGAKANVVTPAPDFGGGQTAVGKETAGVNMPKKKKSEKPLFLRVTMWFLIVVTILFIVLAILYLVFTTMTPSH